MTAPDAMRAKRAVVNEFRVYCDCGDLSIDYLDGCQHDHEAVLKMADAIIALREKLTRLTQIETALDTLDAWFKAHPDQYGEDGWIMYDSAQRLIIARQYGYEDISAPSVAELIPKLDTLTPAGGATDE
jgi:hypothetical protein